MICVLGLGLDLVADYFYYDYCTGSPDWNFVADHVNSGYRTICVLGLGLDSVADHFYYNYYIGTPDWISVSRTCE